MSRINAKVKEIERQIPGPALNGPDDDLSAFIASLIDQNSELLAKLEHLDNLKELADKTVLEAHKEADTIRMETEKKANDDAAAILARAEEKAKAAAQKIVARAKEKAEKIIAEAKQEAEAALRTTAEASKAAESAEKAEQVYEAISAAPELPEPLAIVCANAEITAEKTNEQPARPEEDSKEKSSPTYNDAVELVIPPPVALDHLLKLHKHLKKTPQIKVMDLKGSIDKGVTIGVLLQPHTQLLSILTALPEVLDVSDELIEAGKRHPDHQRGKAPSIRKIAVMMKN